jgi:hypothetical protein
MKKLILVIGLLVLATSAYAGSVGMTFVGFSPGGWESGYAYYATMNGGPVIDVMCNDWAHGGLPGQKWPAYYTNLGTGSLKLLRFNTLTDAQTLYDEAGWLLLQTEVAPKSEWQSINYAVWNIFDSSAPLLYNAPSWLAQAQKEASLGFPGVDFSQVGIYTPTNQYDTNPSGPQELLTLSPEPGTLLLLASGLAGLLTRKRLW